MLRAQAHLSSLHIQAMDTTSKATSCSSHQLAQPHNKPLRRGARGENKSPYGDFYKVAF